jgi:anti-anti-sigma factor
MEFNVKVRQKSRDAFVIQPEGRLDSNTAIRFESEINQILQRSTRLIVMDLQDLDYLSSAGVRVIIKTRNALKKNGGKLVFMNLSPQIKKVFDIINALPAMQIFMSVEELDDYLDIMQKRAKSQN